tara:strand:+ start:1388 stop:2314 length:927 start_codon:yes stop_codon:yes gene_type:complete
MEDKILKLFNKSKFNKPTPKSYDKFALQPNTADFERLYQSGDPIGSRNSYIPRTRKSGLAIAASASEEANAAPTVTITPYRSFLEKNLVTSGSLFKFTFADADGDALDLSSYTLSTNGLLSSSHLSNTVALARATGSLNAGTYNFTGSIADVEGNATSFSSSFTVFSGSFLSLYKHSTILHVSSEASSSSRNLQNPIRNYSASQFKAYVAGYNGRSGGSGQKLLSQHIPMQNNDVIFGSDGLPTSGINTSLYEEPGTGNLLIVSGGLASPGFSLPSRDFQQVFVVGNTGSTPVITRDGSDGFPALASW